MKRLLPAAGLALALHAGLLWWWGEWQPATTKSSDPAREITLELAALAPPAAAEPPATTKTPEAASSIPPAPLPESPPQQEKTPAEPEPIKPLPPELETTPENKPSELGKEKSRQPATPVTEPTINQAEKVTRLPAPVAPQAPDAESSSPEPPTQARPLYRYNPEPDYPLAARRRQQEGTVLLEVIVTAEGRVEAVEVISSSGHETLDRAAIRAVERWRFEPGRQNDQPVRSRAQVPIRFELTSR